MKWLLLLLVVGCGEDILQIKYTCDANKDSTYEAMVYMPDIYCHGEFEKALATISKTCNTITVKESFCGNKLK